MKVFIWMIPVVILLAGCASGGYDEPIVDMKGVNRAQYERDLEECRAYAAQVDVGGEAVEGAVGGAIFGGILGAIFGNSDSAERGAGGGAVVGGAKGAGQAVERQERVIRNCLRQRGYKVLG